MAATLVPPETKHTPREAGPGRNDNDSGGVDFGDGHGPGDRGPLASGRTCRTGVWMALAAIVMLFATFTSALVVRKGLSDDWRPIPLPGILWLNTLVLLVSSATLVRSRRAFFDGRRGQSAFWWYITTGLGIAFIVGQLTAWRKLSTQGVFLASNPSSSFFYLLTAAHGLHLVGGICALSYASLRLRRPLLSRVAVEVIEIYWHCMDGLWVYLFFLLSAGRWI